MPSILVPTECREPPRHRPAALLPPDLTQSVALLEAIYEKCRPPSPPLLFKYTSISVGGVPLQRRNGTFTGVAGIRLSLRRFTET